MVVLPITNTFLVLISFVVGQVYASDDTITEEWDDSANITFPGQWPFEIYNNASGDVNLTRQQETLLNLKKALVDVNSRWPEGDDGFPLVQYLFLDNVNQTDVRRGIDHWIEHTCIKFNETQNRKQPHIQFHISGGCWSMLGMLHQNGQKISIGRGCNSMSVVAHEIGHALGFYHEQSRGDRDDYVYIVRDNIIPGTERQFRKAYDNNFGVEYDYSSLMHYGGFGFSRNRMNTIVAKDPLAQELMGMRGGLSHRDKFLANQMYKCIDKWVKLCGLPSDPCLNDGYTGKNCTCICPSNTNGSNCETILPDYYANKRSALTEKITSEKNISIMQPTRGTFTKWITPPSCMRAVLTFKYNDIFKDCKYEMFIVRTDPTNIAGRKMCYRDVQEGPRIESDWEIIISMYSSVDFTSVKLLWEAEVTFEDICASTTPHPTSMITSPEPTSSPGPCPICPTTPDTCPTNPATCPPTTESTSCPSISCPPVTTTKPPRPSRRILCTPKGDEHTVKIAKGRAVTIVSPRYPNRYPREKFTCGWKLKAKGGGRLTVTCDKFRVHHRDRLEIVSEKGVFRNNQRPYFDINQLVILFKSKKESRGRGFRCTVVSE